MLPKFVPLTDEQAHELGNRILARLTKGRKNSAAVVLDHPSAHYLLLPRSVLPSNVHSMNGKAFYHERSIATSVDKTWFIMERIGPLIFIVLNRDRLQTIGPMMRMIKKKLGALYEQNAGNIIITMPPAYSSPEFKNWLIKPIVSILSEPEIYRNARVTDFRAGNALLARVLLRLGAKQVVLLEKPRSSQLVKRKRSLPSENPIAEARAYLREEGWKKGTINYGHYFIVEADLAQTDIAQVYADRGIKESTEMAIVNIGPSGTDGNTNEVVVHMISAWPHLRHILNAGYQGIAPGHQQALLATERMLRGAGWNVSIPDTGTKWPFPARLLVANRNLASAALPGPGRAELRRESSMSSFVLRPSQHEPSPTVMSSKYDVPNAMYDERTRGELRTAAEKAPLPGVRELAQFVDRHWAGIN